MLSDDAYLGYNSVSSGTATITGAGSTWTNNGSLSVGESGSGTLNIEAGGQVSSYSAYLGGYQFSSGTTTVTGSDSMWTINSDFRVGASGSGMLYIEAGGEVISGNGSYYNYLGYNTGSTGTVTVTGNDSKWTINGYGLYIGYGGNGTLNIEAGGQVINSGGCQMGTYSNSTGTVTVTGTGSTWINNGGVNNSYYGNCILNIEAGGQVISSTGSLGGGNLGSNTRGTATVTGTESKWTMSTDFTVGDGGLGTLQIEASGQVSCFNGYLGKQRYSLATNSTATVTGAGSKWTNNNNLYIGFGTLRITEGGVVSDVDGYLGYNCSGSQYCIVTISGTDSMWINSGNFYIGRYGNGTLNIEAGGKVSNTDGYLGYNSSPITTTVTGNGSTWTNSGDLRVGIGNSGNGILNIEASGQVSNSNGYLGYDSGSTGTATVSDTGSTWTNSGNLYVGYSGNGTLNVAGGWVKAVTLTLANSSGFTGTCNLNNGGTLQVGTITQGCGTANFNWNDGVIQNLSPDADLTISYNLSIKLAATGTHAFYIDSGRTGTIDAVFSDATTSGTLVKDGAGILILSGNNTYTGVTTVNGGSLQIGNGASTGSISGNVFNNGDLIFNRSSYIYGGSISGSGSLAKQGNNTLTLTGDNTYTGLTTISGGTLQIGNDGTTGSISGNILIDTNCTLTFNRSDPCTFERTISGAGSLTQQGTGVPTLTGTNDYTGVTTIRSGALQADIGIGIPSTSFLRLDGGVLQNNESDSFTRGLGGIGSTFWWSSNGGGFSAGTNAFNVNVGNGTALTWGTSVGSQIVGTLKFGSPTAANVTIFHNSVNLGSTDRTIQVDDNIDSSIDYALMSGNISGSGGIVKTGDGMLTLTGTNTYNGDTVISNGTLQADVDVGIPSTSCLQLDGGVLQNKDSDSFTRGLGGIGSTFWWSSNGGGFSAGTLAFNVNVGNGTALTWGSSGGPRGTLKFGSSTAANVTTFCNNINLNGSNRTVQVDDNPNSSADYAVLSGILSNSTGTAGIIKTGTGLLLLTGDNTFNGVTTISEGTIQIGNGGTTGCVSGNIANDSILVFNRSDNYAFAKSISGTGSLIQQGPGVLTLTGSMTYTGDTIIRNSVLETNVMTPTSFLCLDGGVLQSNGVTSFTRELGTSGSTFQWTANGGGFSAGTPPLNVNIGYGTALTWGTSVGSQIIGTLKLSSSTASNVTTFLNPIDLGGEDRTVQVDDNINLSADYAVISGNITNSNGTAGIHKTGNGRLDLSGNNFYNGTTTVDDGILRFANSNAMTSCDYIVNGGTLDIGGISKSIGTFRITGGTVTGNTLTSNAPYDIQGGTVNARLAGTVGLTKTGEGTATVTAPIYTGTTTIQEGTLTILGTLPGGNYAIHGGILDIGTLSRPIGYFQMTGGTVSGTSTLTSNAPYDVQAGTINANLAGPIGLNKTGAGTAILNGQNTYMGGTTVSGGTLQIGNGGTTGSITGNIVNNSALVFNRSISFGFPGNIYGSGNLIQEGAGMLTLAGNNTYSGTTTVNAGILSFSSINAMSAGDYVVNGGTLDIGSISKSIGTFQITGGTVIGNTLTSNATYDIQAGSISARLAGEVGLYKTGPGTAILNAPNTYTGDTIISDGVLQANINFGLPSTCFLCLDGGVLQTNGTFIRGLGVSGNTFQWTANGGGFSAGMGCCSVIVGEGVPLTWGTSVGSQIVGTLKLGSSTAANITAFANPIDLGGADRTIQVDDNPDTTADWALMPGNITNSSGTAGIIKTGDGKLVLNGANSYNGATIIIAGTLALAPNGQINPLSTIDNDATFLIDGGTHTVGTIIGTGVTQLNSGTQLITPSITQGTLIIGSVEEMTELAPVPEPGALTLLVSLGVTIAAGYLHKKRRDLSIECYARHNKYWPK
ncbi:MAG: autotransporter-associated beta strand repeat-containing protein [Pirellulales bacterium]|nr:autotransporter-associated beta strand repeat-containing protein [Pirellulales bacterium]